jgi:hypothetical protein
MYHGGYYIYPVKLAAPPGVFDLHLPQRAPVFTPEMLLYAAFIHIYPFLLRYPGYPPSGTLPAPAPIFPNRQMFFYG